MSKTRNPPSLQQVIAAEIRTHAHEDLKDRTIFYCSPECISKSIAAKIRAWEEIHL